jgi:hypothetical protein
MTIAVLITNCQCGMTLVVLMATEAGLGLVMGVLMVGPRGCCNFPGM